MNMKADTTMLEDVSHNRDPFLCFVTDHDSESIFAEIIDDLLLPDETLRRGTLPDARRYLSQVRSPNLLVVDIDDIDDPLEEVTNLADVCELGTKLVVIGTSNDAVLFRELLTIGASDYLVKPLSKEQVLLAISAVEEGASDHSNLGRLGKVVAVVGARGGVGSSMLTANCGWAVSEKAKRKVALVDLDLYFGNLALLMGVDAREGLAEALEKPERIDELFLERVMAPAAERLFVLGGEETLGENEGFKPDAVDILLKELRAKFHFVFVDLPREPSYTMRRTLQIAGTTIVVSDLSLSGMRDTVRLLRYIRESNPGGKTLLVVNRTGENKKSEIPVAEFEKGVGCKIDLKLPFEANAALQAENLGKPLADGRSSLSKSIQEFAGNFQESSVARSQGKGRKAASIAKMFVG